MTQQTSSGFLPVVYANAGYASKYVNGLALSVASNTTLTIGAGACRDSTNGFDLFLGAPYTSTPVSTTLTATGVGLNGIDTGTFAASKVYAVYVIASSMNAGPTGTILSLSTTTPTLPFQYDIFRRVGWAVTDSSTHFLALTQTGVGSSRNYFYDTMQIVLSGGSQTTTFAAVDLSAFVPTIVTPVTFSYIYTPASASNVAKLRATGSTATTVNQLKASGAAAIDGQITIFTGIAASKAEVDYVVISSDTLSLYVYSFADSL